MQRPAKPPTRVQIPDPASISKIYLKGLFLHIVYLKFVFQTLFIRGIEKFMREKVRQGYEAGDYEGQYRNNRGIRPEEEELFDKLFEKIPEKGEVVDLGCGTGEPFDRFLVDQGYDVTGVDLVEKHIYAARKHVPEAHFFQGDFFDVKAEKGKFDAVVSFYAIFHVPREEHSDLFEHINNLLREDGTILVTLGGSEMDEHQNEDWADSEMVWSSYSQEKNLELIENAGFDIVETYEEESDEEHHLWVLAEKK